MEKLEVRMSKEEKEKIIAERGVKEILFQDDLKGKTVFHNEDKLMQDGSFDLIYYYIDKKADPHNPEDIWVDTYSKRKSREKSIREFKRRRQRV